MRKAVASLGLVLALVVFTGCTHEIRITNAASVPVSMTIYRDGSPVTVGSLAPGESRLFPLGDCSGSMTAVESASGRVVAVLDGSCVDSWTVRE